MSAYEEFVRNRPRLEQELRDQMVDKLQRQLACVDAAVKHCLDAEEQRVYRDHLVEKITAILASIDRDKLEMIHRADGPHPKYYALFAIVRKGVPSYVTDVLAYYLPPNGGNYILAEDPRFDGENRHSFSCTQHYDFGGGDPLPESMAPRMRIREMELLYEELTNLKASIS